MKETKNKVYIEGILSEVDIKAGTFKKDGKDQEYLGGTITVRVYRPNEEAGKEPIVNEVKVSLFASKFDKTGKIGKPYEAVEKVMHMTSIAACSSEELADRVRFEASLAENTFYAQDGALVNDTRINATFINKISQEICVPRAVFDLDVIIGSIKDVIKDDAPTGEIIINAILVKYGDKIDVIPFIVRKPTAVKYIQSNWEKGQLVTIQGIVNYTHTTKTISEPTDFGDPIVTTKITSIKELLITGGSSAGSDDVYTSEELNKGISARTARLEEAKNKKKPEATGKTGRADIGF